MKNKAFSFVEYVLLAVIIFSALVGMSVYLKRTLCGKYRSAADTFGFGRQYEE